VPVQRRQQGNTGQLSGYFCSSSLLPQHTSIAEAANKRNTRTSGKKKNPTKPLQKKPPSPKALGCTLPAAGSLAASTRAQGRVSRGALPRPQPAASQARSAPSPSPFPFISGRRV